MKKYLILLILCSSLIVGSSANTGVDEVRTQQISSASASVFNVDDRTPTPDQAVNIVAEVKSPVGIAGAELIYSYSEIPDSRTVKTMSLGTPLDVTPANYAFEDTQIDAIRVGSNFTFIADYLTRISGTVDNSGGPADLTYFEVSVYNLTTAEWQIYDTAGSPDGTAEIAPVNFNYNVGASGGVKIYAINLRNNNNGQYGAELSALTLEAEKYFEGTIDAAGLSTQIDYFIKGTDNNGNVFFSQNNTIYSNNHPSVTSFNDVPSFVGGDIPWFANITVEDLDGIDTLSRVKLAYKLESQETWSSITMERTKTLSNVSAEYTISVPLQQFVDVEGNLQFYINMTDVVSGVEQNPTKSSTQVLLIDQLGPVLQGNVQITADPLINNSTKVNSSIQLDMSFFDTHGVKSASIQYSLSGGNLTTDVMTNASLLQESDTTEDFSYEFPGYANDTTIAYNFLTEDFIGNVYTSEQYFLYVDATGPHLLSFHQSPKYASNTTDVVLSYTVGDSSGLADQVFYYQPDYDNSSWTDIAPEVVDYNNEIKFQESTTLSDVPKTLLDDATNVYNMSLAPTIPIDEATLDISLTHSRPTDLRIYLTINDSKFLVFDRENVLTKSFSLLDYFKTTQLQGTELVIEVVDVAEDFSGTLDDVTVTFFDYNIPAGQDYKVVVPALGQDGEVFYYFDFTDNLGNIRTTPVRSIYFDGVAPKIASYTIYDGVQDLAGASSIYFEATIEERGGIDTVELYYRYNGTSTWTIIDMYGNQSTFNTNLSVLGAEGSFDYQIRVFDKVGNEAITPVHLAQYKNANAPTIKLLTRLSSVYDADGSEFVTVEARVTDGDGIDVVKVTYSVNGVSNRTSKMIAGPSGTYLFDIPINQDEGVIEFVITAIDQNGQNASTELFTLEYENANAPSDFPWVPVILGGLGVIALISIGYLIFRRMSSQDDIFIKTPL